MIGFTTSNTVKLLFVVAAIVMCMGTVAEQFQYAVFFFSASTLDKHVPVPKQ